MSSKSVSNLAQRIKTIFRQDYFAASRFEE
jgi:hypothetical protein